MLPAGGSMELSLRFIEELALLLLLAAGTAVVFTRLKIPPVLGYLIAGSILGPGGLAIITTGELISVLGDLGVILLMFGLGLDFEINRVKKTATFSVIAGVASVMVTFVAINACALLFGLSPLESLFLAAALAICGTAVNLKILSDMGHLKTSYGSAITATIVVTDIAAVLLLTALSGIALGGGLDARSLAVSLFKAASFLVLAPAFGFLVVPRLLNMIARETRSREAILISTLALCFLMSLVSQWLGFSLALGAFVMGMVVSEARVYHPIEEMVKPIEIIFVTLFFFSVGLSLSIGAALPHWAFIGVLVLIVAVTKAISVSSVAYLSGQSGRVALIAGWGLVPIGEFAFVIVNEGVRFGVMPIEYLSVTVAVALGTTGVAVAGLQTLGSTITTMTNRLPAGVLNLFTLIQLRTAGSSVVPGLAEATIHLPQSGGAASALRSKTDIFEQERKRLEFHRAAQAELIDIGLNCVLIVTIVLVVIGLGNIVSPVAPMWLNIKLAAAGVAVVLCVPSIVFLFKSGADLANILSARLADRFSWVDPRVTRGALLAGSMLMLFIFLQVAVLPIVLVELKDFGLPVILVAAVITLGLGYFAWRSLMRFQAALTGLVRSSLASAGQSRPQPAPEKTLRRKAKDQKAGGAPYRAMIEEYFVPARSRVAGKSIGESGIRVVSGVSILGIQRKGEWIGNPGVDELIQAGDELIVIGSQEQRENAEQFLLEEEDGESQAGPVAG
jgi:CPA2 family monovalent cation:H+ antiporter-2